jgi:TonB family protein
MGTTAMATVSSWMVEYFEMKGLALAVLAGSLLWTDLEQKVESRVHLSRAVGDSLIQFRIQPICPYYPCGRCVNGEVWLKLVVKKGGTVKRVIVVKAGDSRLAEAALDAVQYWRYRSYVQNGSPVEFETYTTIDSWKCAT